MFSSFSFNRLFTAVAAFTIIAAVVPAYGANQKPEVEVDLSVLQNLPARPQPVPVYNPAPINNPAPVEVAPLQPGYISRPPPAQPAVSEPPPPVKPAPPPKAKAVHKAAVVKKKKPPAPRPHPVPPPAHKPQVATTKAPVAPKVAPAPATTLLSIDAPMQNPAVPDDKKPAMNIEDISAAQNVPPPAPAPVSVAPPQPVPIKTIQPPHPPVAPAAPAVTAPKKTAQIVPAQPPPALPQPVAIKTAVAPAPAPAPAPVPVPPAAPAQTVPEKTTPPASVTAPPSDKKQDVPRPPPADSRETSHFSLPFKAGVADQLDSQITSTLQSQILPLLKDHPAWRLRINAFASPVDSEPISARRVSLARALAVRAWLLDKGVAARRIDVRAAGLETGHEPADRVDIVFLDPDGG